MWVLFQAYSAEKSELCDFPHSPAECDHHDQGRHDGSKKHDISCALHIGFVLIEYINEFLGKHLGVDQRIIAANPTDGLWDDGRTDEDQIGCSYGALEEAMEAGTGPGVDILYRFNQQNQHKMNPIPTFKL